MVLLLVKINDQVFKKDLGNKEEKYEDLALHTSQPNIFILPPHRVRMSV